MLVWDFVEFLLEMEIDDVDRKAEIDRFGAPIHVLQKVREPLQNSERKVCDGADVVTITEVLESFRLNDKLRKAAISGKVEDPEPFLDGNKYLNKHVFKKGTFQKIPLKKQMQLKHMSVNDLTMNDWVLVKFTTMKKKIKQTTDRNSASSKKVIEHQFIRLMILRETLQMQRKCKQNFHYLRKTEK
ncbi:hypothetical protein HHI36_008626 [Cryptolaemus montrouzieri]|uniref:Uncharacterized protein n=1 Tax=Cryptolaemus montrouzieri TaxID=559131 RepID=A0ABD2MTW9_9CUCU